MKKTWVNHLDRFKVLKKGLSCVFPSLFLFEKTSLRITRIWRLFKKKAWLIFCIQRRSRLRQLFQAWNVIFIEKEAILNIEKRKLEHNRKYHCYLSLIQGCVIKLYKSRNLSLGWGIYDSFYWVSIYRIDYWALFN